jgi:hypothetical protein
VAEGLHRLGPRLDPGTLPQEPVVPKAAHTSMDKNFKRTFATAAWITQSEGTVARWGVPRGPSVS